MNSVAQVLADQTTFQLLPALTETEYSALKDDIREHGVLVPVEVDEQGNILDGHHRVKAYTELRTEGVKVADYLRITRIGLSDAEKRAHAIRLNINRRHLNRQQRDELIVTLKQMTNYDGSAMYSNDDVAEMVGVSEPTVRRTVSSNDETVFPVATRGSDGKNYPAKKPRAVLTKNSREQGRAQEALAFLGSDAPDTVVDVKRVERMAREKQAEERRAQPVADSVLGGIDLWFGDFRERAIDIPRNSIDLIFTDPPYHEAYLDLWSALSFVAARVLKPGGALVTYSGQKYLPTVMQLLGEHLEYFWLCAVRHSGGDAQRHQQRIRNGFKPVLFYVKPPAAPWWEYMPDIVSGGQEKDSHDWQQAEHEARHYIRHLCPAGGMVLDPMCGGGTTLAAARSLGLRAIGIDSDAAAIAAAKARCGDA